MGGGRDAGSSLALVQFVGKTRVPVLRAVALISSLIAFSALGAEADAGVLPPLQLQVRATPDKVKVGEPFVVELVVTHLPTQRYELKTPSDLGDFDYRGQERKRVDAADQSTTTITVSMAGFVLGKQRTPKLTLEITEASGAVELPVGGAEVEIVTALPADAQTKGANLYDVRPPEEIPVRTWRVLYALAALAALGGLIWAIFKYRSRIKPLQAFQPPPEPLDVRTLKALDELAARNLPGQGHFKPFYFRLSEIVRAYLGERYGFEALECTTPELLQAIRNRETPGLAVEQLTDFANGSDFVRYARFQPGIDDCKRHLDLSYRLVRETTAALRPLAPPPPAARRADGAR